MAELDDIYAPELLEKAANITRIGALEAPDASATAHSRLCGSTISVDLNIEAGRVSNFAQRVEACLLGQSAAAIMAENIIGSSESELREVGEIMRKMLKEDGKPPSGKWADLGLLENVRHFGARHTSTLLVFAAVNQAFDKLHGQKEAG